VTLEEFREKVFARFGRRLERANPEDVRHFLDEMQALLYPPTRCGDHLILEPESADLDYAAMVREFLAASLASPPEEGLVGVWLFALELWFYNLQEEVDERFAALIREWQRPSGGSAPPE